MADESGVHFLAGQEEYLVEMRGLTTDAQGRKHLRGLSIEESSWYLAYLNRDRASDRRSIQQMDADRDRFLELDDRYEAARKAVLIAENELRNDSPTRN